ncbi:N-formylglutamate amidohydrolase [Candidatus Woesearchaeota archaeon]|nr:N-formylglutamate amidohydrolase [Candidatus Woesearchaeota archaeon]
MVKLKEMIRKISPVLISPTSTSLTISLSKRFFLFTFMNKAIRTIEDDPYLNFISLLKNYKILGRILYGTLDEFYRDRNSLYFKNFFMDNKLYQLVKSDLIRLKDYKDIKMTITKRGVIIYDNYKKNSFNVLLMTAHSGTWLPKKIKEKMNLKDEFRYIEEDVETDKIYSRLVLEKAGIWIDNKMSRFACDFNRGVDTSIYTNKSETFFNVRRLWKKKLSKAEIKDLHKSYADFYFTLAQLIDSYRFNIIFDGHSMKNLKGRPGISFGVKYVPHFYLPIVKSMQKKLNGLGYNPVRINYPYSGGYILRWLNSRFPDVFIFSMEINKSLYMTKNMKKIKPRKMEKLSKDLEQVFDIEVDDFESY